MIKNRVHVKLHDKCLEFLEWQAFFIGFSLFLNKVSLYTLAGLELPVVSLNWQWSTYLCLLDAGVKSMWHHGQPWLNSFRETLSKLNSTSICGFWLLQHIPEDSVILLLCSEIWRISVWSIHTPTVPKAKSCAAIMGLSSWLQSETMILIPWQPECRSEAQTLRQHVFFLETLTWSFLVTVM